MAGARKAGLLAVALLASETAGAADLLSRVDDLRWQARVLVIFADGPDDPLLRDQMDRLGDAAGEARDRDLVVMPAFRTAPGTAALRSRLVPGTQAPFQVVLVGKDGLPKTTSSRPIGPSDLFAIIDRMPMRRQEMLRRAP